MVETYESLREKLADAGEKSAAETQKRALASQLHFHGTKKSAFNKIAAEFAESNRDAISLTPIEPLLDALWKGNTYEERLLALRFLLAFRGLLGEREWVLLTKWAETAENWSLADWIAHVRAWLLRRYPERVSALINWCKSPDPLVRRAAVVSLLVQDPEEKERTQIALQSRQALRVIEAAMFDTDPVVQKATVWVAREIGREAPEHLARLLDQYKEKAPKSFLVAAAESLPERLREDLHAALEVVAAQRAAAKKAADAKAAEKAERAARAAANAKAKAEAKVAAAAKRAAAAAAREQAKAAKEAKAAMQAKQAAQAKQAKQAKPAGAGKAAKATKTAKAGKPTKATRPAKAVKAARPAKPAKPTKLAQGAKPPKGAKVAKGSKTGKAGARKAPAKAAGKAPGPARPRAAKEARKPARPAKPSKTSKKPKRSR